ncbi:hypothetical protein TrCOL_g6794 [Triparma columacea]|uniref:Vta1/callose synthase N-terminal domain-containing protein n=1 Tax=Triparma columacea TaxID=722753 RepID=A0A9W7G0J0_9STRA|nr:hypothetical protein TrCOL_g6794 [Triparma columacea]
MDIPASLKSIKPFVKRAEELDNDRTQPASRLVAYYCRQYALELAIPLLKTANDPKAQECAMNIMNALEVEKKAVGEAFSKHEAYGIVRDFATKVLQGGDKQYEAVYAKNSRDYASAKVVCRSYYAAGSFFDVLSIFEQTNVDEAVLELEVNTMKRKYCKWRASEIFKAIKTGTDLPEPKKEDGAVEDDGEEKASPDEEKGLPDSSSLEPPSYKEEVDDPFGIPEAPTSAPSFPAESKDSAEDDDPPPVFKPLAPSPAPAPPPSAPASAPSPEAAAPKRSSWFGSKKKSSSTPKESIADAIELSKFAIAALEGKEIDLARQRLQKALDCLN